MAANGVSRYSLGATFPLFAVQSQYPLPSQFSYTLVYKHTLTWTIVYETLGIGWATSLLGFLSLVMIPIPYLFFKYGPSIRARSRYPVAT